MERILIIGCCGAGKTTLAQKLGTLLKIEVVNLDRHYWKPGWVRPHSDDWEKVLRTLLEKEQWIMDGNYRRTLEMRMSYADTIIFLDHGRSVCLWRAITKHLRHKNIQKEVAPGCPHKVDWEFVKWIWQYPKNSRLRECALLDQYKKTKSIHILRTQKDITAFLAHTIITP